MSDLGYSSGCSVRYPPTQLFPVMSTSKPALQLHLYVLSMFSHTPLKQMSGSRAHSLISGEVSLIKLIALFHLERDRKTGTITKNRTLKTFTSAIAGCAKVIGAQAL